MNQSELVPPPRQEVFEFARTEIWSQMPIAAQEECLRLIVKQLKQTLEYEQKETNDE